ncbi:MAG: hypothetical protein Q9168_006954, partial [Polycauliona sp. 1 TL-2023]
LAIRGLKATDADIKCTGGVDIPEGKSIIYQFLDCPTDKGLGVKLSDITVSTFKLEVKYM